MRTIILTKGLPGSGKSTWAKKEVIAHPGKYIRINRDLMRSMLLCGEGNQRMENMITSFRDRMVETSLAKGFDIILDDTNLSERHFRAMIDIADRFGNVQVIEKFFDTSLKECLKNNENRENPVPPHIIKKMHDRYLKNKKVEARTYFSPPKKLKKEDESKTSAFILDIDGTLALNLGKRDYYDLSTVLNDDPHTDIITIANALKKAGHTIIIVSGRDDVSKEDTILWLNSHGVLFDEIYMRKTGDVRKDWIIKEEFYNRHLKNKYAIKGVIDDRPQVVRMWRRIGMTALQINDFDF